MQIGRNALCPCGSGKKYKKCCLPKDTAAAKQTREALRAAAMAAEQEEMTLAEVPPPVFPARFKPLVPIIKLDEPEDPLLTAINTFYEAFMAADYQARWEMAETMLAETPEVCDGGMAFEIVSELVQTVVTAGDYARFLTLLKTIQTQAPAAWESELSYMLEWKTIFAQIMGDRETLQEAFTQLSQVANNDLDIYYRALPYLAWHDEHTLLLAGLRLARVSIQNSEGLVPWTYTEFAEKLGDYDLVHEIITNPQLTADDPVLRQRFTDEYKLKLVDEFEESLAYHAGQKTPAFALADYVVSLQHSTDKDAARTRLAYLVRAFSYYAWQVEGIPLTRVELGRERLYMYLVLRGLGKLEEEQSKKANRRRSKSAQIKTEVHPLELERRQVNAYLTRYVISFLFIPYHEIVAFFSLIPAWLRYLSRLQLLDVSRVDSILVDLKPLTRDLINLVESSVYDNALIQSLKAWPSGGTSEAALQQRMTDAEQLGVAQDDSGGYGPPPLGDD